MEKNTEEKRSILRCVIKKEENKRFKEVEKVRTAEEVWKVVNKERKTRKRVNQDIKMLE